MLKSENILALIAEVDAAKKRAAAQGGSPEFTLAEQLDFYRGADQAAANRFDVLAQAYRELLAGTKQELRGFYSICESYRRKKTIVPVTRYDVHDAAERLGISLADQTP